MKNIKAGGRAAIDAAIRALAVFALLDLVVGLSTRHDPNDIWIHADFVPRWILQALVVSFALGVLLLRRLPAALERATRALAALLAVACLGDACAFYRLLARGSIASSLPVPLSLILALLLLAWAATASRRRLGAARATRRGVLLRVLQHGAPAALLGLGTLLHILTFGATDYVRTADAAIVFGAAVRPDGAPSHALRDRTRTACALYRRGLVHTLVLSGGRDPDAPLSEPACMARIAAAEGVPASALVLDETGEDSAATVAAARRLAEARGWHGLLMVSHDYHLARIKLACERAGLPAWTVPAVESRWLGPKPWFTAREVIAWAWYYVRPALGCTNP